jgi:hypothetical protein
MSTDYRESTAKSVAVYDPADPATTAATLEELWLQAPAKEVGALTEVDRDALKAVGVPVAILRDIGKGIRKVARKRVDDFLPLIQLLWYEYGREGRIVAVQATGPMELAAPEQVLPVI